VLSIQKKCLRVNIFMEKMGAYDGAGTSKETMSAGRQKLA
jgi:hypothetical protein